MNIRTRFIIPLFFLILVTSCASLSTYKGRGVYHRVRKGETLWRISQSYDVSIRTIMKANAISHPGRIKAGEKLFVPYAKKVLEVKPYKITREERALKGYFIWPVKGKVISTFGVKGKFWNPGIEISAPRGRKIVASQEGVIIYSDENMRGYGKVIMIEHKNGYITVYAHNLVNLVKEGEEIKKGEIIGQVGSTGRPSKPCLHFEIRKRGKACNPLLYLP